MNKETTSLEHRTIPVTMPDGLPGRVEAIDAHHVLCHIVPGYRLASAANRLTWSDEIALVLAWCRDNGAHHYARGREDFCFGEAASEAVERGLTRVVYENLS